MVADEQGFDPDKNYTQADNEFWDGTDGAHPAWWRGEEYGVKASMRELKKWLDDPIDEVIKGSTQPFIQELRQRIVDLRKRAEKLDN